MDKRFTTLGEAVDSGAASFAEMLSLCDSGRLTAWSPEGWRVVPLRGELLRLAQEISVMAGGYSRELLRFRLAAGEIEFSVMPEIRAELPAPGDPGYVRLCEYLAALGLEGQACAGYPFDWGKSEGLDIPADVFLATVRSFCVSEAELEAALENPGYQPAGNREIEELRARIAELEEENRQLLDKSSVNAAQWQRSLEAVLAAYVNVFGSGRKWIKDEFVAACGGSSGKILSVINLAWRSLPAKFKKGSGRPQGND